ncbi:hypothetical protein niasHT_038734 [Heterodera trifolii]|uniref:Chromo domain-containing protein n=1 Tax=Heterodera trifolii TaxID=157864 RepID=A0ABD2IUG5_9BILA
MEHPFEIMPVDLDDSLLSLDVSPTNSFPIDPPLADVDSFVPDLVPELCDDSAEYSSDSEEFEVERICGQKIENGQQFYLVKWKGFAKSQNDWEPEENLLNCQPKILQYWRRRQYDKKYRARTKDDEKSARGGKKKKSKADEEKPNAAMDVEPDPGEKAKDELGAAPGEVLEEETESLEEGNKGKPESADAGPEIEQLKKMLRDSDQMPMDNAPLPLPRWVRGSGAFKKRLEGRVEEVVRNGFSARVGGVEGEGSHTSLRRTVFPSLSTPMGRKGEGRGDV